MLNHGGTDYTEFHGEFSVFLSVLSVSVVMAFFDNEFLEIF